MKTGINKNCAFCNKEFYAAPWEIKRNRKYCNQKCSTTATRGKSLNANEKNGQWKGEKVGYTAIHDWVKRHLVKPQTCRDCNQVKPLDLANISQKYKRDISDWEWLCRKCHMAKDGRAKTLRFARPHTLEEREKMSKALKGKPKSEEWKTKRRGKKLIDGHYK